MTDFLINTQKVAKAYNELFVYFRKRDVFIILFLELDRDELFQTAVSQIVFLVSVQRKRGSDLLKLFLVHLFENCEQGVSFRFNTQIDIFLVSREKDGVCSLSPFHRFV